MATRQGATIDSGSIGDPARFLSLEDLESGLAALLTVPADRGCVALIVRRGEHGRRQTPNRLLLTPEAGVPGDAWGRKDGATPESQITVMQADVAELIANGQPLTLFGDNLFLDVDLSTKNLTPGSRVRVGEAVLEVTAKPHNGCSKFSGRFGVDALRFTAKPETRFRNFRGVYMRVVEAGEAGPGDLVEVIERVSVAEEAVEIVEADLERADHQRDVLALTNAYALDPMGNGAPLPPEKLDRLIDGLRRHPTTVILLAYVGERAVGIATCFLGYSTFAAKPLLNVHDLAVLPEHRGHRVGSKLLEAVEQKARALGCCKITLEVGEDNARAKRIYELAGFAQPSGDAAGSLLFYAKSLT